MNNRERQMLDILKQLKVAGCVAVKAEFEAEGTRVDELLRLLEIARKADLSVGLKIGGCEAIRDLIEAKQFGVEYIIAPMVETPYALSKFIAAKNKVFSQDEQEDTKFLFNVETLTTYQHLQEMAAVASAGYGVDGIVVGRVDFVESHGWSREDVNSPAMTHYCLEVANQCKQKNLDIVVGGGVSLDALSALRAIKQLKLDRFETRKIIFSSRALDNVEIDKALLSSVHFELLWLLNKRDYHGFIQSEDAKRIEMLNSRWNIL